MTYTITKDQVNEDYLQQPGDFVIFDNAPNSDEIIVKYMKGFKTSEDKYALCSNRHIKKLKVRKADLDCMDGDLEKLAKYIDQGLKYIIGWSFDETLTAFHTKNDKTAMPADIDIKSNIRFPTQTRHVFKTIAENPKYIQIISTDNEVKIVANALKEWFARPEYRIKTDKTPMVYGRDKEQFTNDQEPLTTEFHFRDCYGQSLAQSAIDEDGYLRLDQPDLPIDIVHAYFIDHDSDKFPQYSQCGIETIPVEALDNSHLQQIINKLALKPKFGQVYAAFADCKVDSKDELTKVTEMHVDMTCYSKDEVKPQQPIPTTGTHSALRNALKSFKTEASKDEWKKEGIGFLFFTRKTPKGIVEALQSVDRNIDTYTPIGLECTAPIVLEKLENAQRRFSPLRSKKTSDFYKDQIRAIKRELELVNPNYKKPSQ